VCGQRLVERGRVFRREARVQQVVDTDLHRAVSVRELVERGAQRRLASRAAAHEDREEILALRRSALSLEDLSRERRERLDADAEERSPRAPDQGHGEVGAQRAGRHHQAQRPREAREVDADRRLIRLDERDQFRLERAGPRPLRNPAHPPPDRGGAAAHSDMAARLAARRDGGGHVAGRAPDSSLGGSNVSSALLDGSA